jgi:hypothetical protein
MAKNDYHVIVYRMLKHLYECLKDGRKLDATSAACVLTGFGVPEEYMTYVVKEMLEEGLVRGPVVVKAWGGDIVVGAADMEITPAGILYLEDNGAMGKVAKALGHVNELAGIAGKML